MKHYNSFEEAYPHIIGEIVTTGDEVHPRKGSSLGGTTELLSYQFSIPSRLPFCRIQERGISWPFALLEPCYLFTNQKETDIVAALSTYAPNLKKLALNEATGKFDGNYGDRISLLDVYGKNNYGASQLIRAYELLKADLYTRRAVIVVNNPIWDEIDGKTKDIPCTMNLQFIYRGNGLHMICHMRSNDIWYGTPHNVMMFTFLQRAMASWLGVDAGSYIHRVNSMHLYDVHRDKACKIYVDSVLKTQRMLSMPAITDYPDHGTPSYTFRRMREIIEFEACHRQGKKSKFKAEHPYEDLLVSEIRKFHLAKRDKKEYNKTTLPHKNHDRTFRSS